MRKIVLILLVFLFSIVTAIAQNNLPPVYEIKSDTAVYETLPDSNWQMLDEHAKRLTIEEVSNLPLAADFHFKKKAINPFDFSDYAYWFRYQLKNTMNRDANIVITTPDNSYVDVYTKEGSIWQHQVTGWLVPWSKREGFKHETAIPLVLKQFGETVTVYTREFKYDGFSQSDYNVKIGFTNNVVQDSNPWYNGSLSEALLFSLVAGIAFIASIFNLFFYKVVREKVYLFYSLFLLSLALIRFSAAIDFLFLKEYPHLNLIIFYPVSSFLFYYLIHFIRHFVETFTYYPKWDKLLKVASIGQLFFIIIPPFLIFVLPVALNKLLFFLSDFMWVIVLPLFVITFLLYTPIKNFDKLRLLYTIPFLYEWGFDMPVSIAFGELNKYFYTLQMPFWLLWLNRFPFAILDLIGITSLVTFFSTSLFRRYQHLQKQILDKEVERAKLIAEQKVELENTVEERTAELKQSLENLKSTQSQLIQQEKMASLGELTAGIAHEIQNPLNFVNNFSEVNRELITEMKEEIEKGNYDEVKLIATDVEENEQKILHHGKRAEAIVKGMLQHSRISTGQKEPTDINALADEYLRLSYHGMRAKDKSFNAEIKTDFDESIGKINVVPQDIGRVLLNLFNNAFYAIGERRKVEGIGYEPTVSVCTKRINSPSGVGGIEIKVADNGIGIPQKVVDKIFQPFFTTKPAGQGTGLGLSLSYDIIKAHGGEIKVETKEGEGSEFVILLPRS